MIGAGSSRWLVPPGSDDGIGDVSISGFREYRRLEPTVSIYTRLVVFFLNSHLYYPPLAFYLLRLQPYVKYT